MPLNMLGKAAAATVLWISACTLSAQSPEPLRYRLEVTINGSPVSGTAEIGPQLAAKSVLEQSNAFISATKVVRRNEAFQLVVFAVAADGSRANLTQSDRLRYIGDGCLTISDQGFVSVVPTSTCNDPAGPSFIVSLLTEGQGKVVGLNEYFFAVTD